MGIVDCVQRINLSTSNKKTKQLCGLKPHGWELQIPVGSRTRTETLVTVGSQTNLSTALAEATISAVHFDATTYAQGDTGKVVVVYNEQVDVTNGATLVVGATGGSDATATADAHDGRTKSSSHLQFLQEHVHYPSVFKVSVEL